MSPAGDYSAGDDRLGAWRAMGAAIKADHVEALCERGGRVVEIGCGDGALLAQLAQRGFAAELAGYEVSAEAVALASQLPGIGTVSVFDGARVPVDDGAFDLAVLSHVIEHVEEPVALLREAARVARRVFVEIPLEDNRSAWRPAKRAEAERIGHVNVFSRATLHALLADAGLTVATDLSDPLGREHHTFWGRRPAGLAKWALRRAAHTATPAHAERWFTVHYAALCEPRMRGNPE